MLVHSEQNFHQNYQRYRLFVMTILRSVIATHGFKVDHSSLEDLVQEGLINLYDCLKKFDSHKGVSFENYSYIRIYGGFIDEFRKNSTIPRRQQAYYKKYQVLKNQHGDRDNQLSDIEIAKLLDVTPQKLRDMVFSWESKSMLSFDNDEDNIVITSFDENPENLFLDNELKINILQAANKLSDVEKEILDLIFDKDLSLSEIKAKLSLSEGRISQIKKRAIEKIKSNIAEQ